MFDWQDFSTGTGSARCEAEIFSDHIGPYTFQIPASAGTWTTYCLYGTNVGRVRVIVNKDGVDYPSAWYPWPNY